MVAMLSKEWCFLILLFIFGPLSPPLLNTHQLSGCWSMDSRILISSRSLKNCSSLLGKCVEGRRHSFNSVYLLGV